MHGDENARDVARRLVQEAVSRADGTLPPAAEASQDPPVATDVGSVPGDAGQSSMDPGPPPRPTEAQRIAHRVVLEALSAATDTGETATERAARRRGAGVLARPTVGGTPAPSTPPDPEPEPALDPEPDPAPDPQPDPAPDPEPAPVLDPEPASVLDPEPEPALDPEPDPVPDPEPAPVLDPEPEPALDPEPGPEPSHPEPAGRPSMPAVSAASAEAARRIVAAAIAEQQPPDEPDPPPLPLSVQEGEATPASEASETFDGPDGSGWPVVSVNLLSADPPAADAAVPFASEPARGPLENAETESLPAVPPAAAQTWVPDLAATGPPPVFPTIGEPGTGRSLLDQPVDARLHDVPEEGPTGQFPPGQRLTPLDRWRARRHRKRLAAQWAPGATPQPRRTWRWVLATVIVAVALGILFPLTVAAFRALVAL
jgi:hypothetical protein